MYTEKIKYLGIGGEEKEDGATIEHCNDCKYLGVMPQDGTIKQ